jgi:soluble lytic murein transglycosylase-like protein
MWVAPQPVHAQTLTFHQVAKEEIKHPSNDGVGEVRPIASPKIEKVNEPVRQTNVPSKEIRPNRVSSKKQNNAGNIHGKGSTNPPSGRSYSKEEIIQLIKDYSEEYNVSPQLPLAIAKCESGYNQYSKNKSSTASGVYQWLSSSWSNQPAARGGVSVFDADANVKAAVWLIAHGKTSPWAASKKCWNK